MVAKGMCGMAQIDLRWSCMLQYLTQVQVQVISEALANIPWSSLSQRHDCGTMAMPDLKHGRVLRFQCHQWSVLHPLAINRLMCLALRTEIRQLQCAISCDNL